MRYLLIIAALVLSSLTGCVSMTPGFGGKTHYSMLFEDNLDATTDPVTGAITAPGQRTKFDVKIDAPAGVDIKNLASMNYDWKDGEGKIAVAGDTAADTTAQMAGMVEVNAQQAQAFTGLIQALAAALPLLTAPVPSGGATGASDGSTAGSGLEGLGPLPTDLAGWIAFARAHPEIMDLLQGFGK